MTHWGGLCRAGFAQRADSQYENLRYALGEVGRERGWQPKQINMIGGTLGSVHVEAFEEMLKQIEDGRQKRRHGPPTIRKEHDRRLLEAQDAVLLAYHEGLHRGGSAMVKHHLGQDIYG